MALASMSRIRATFAAALLAFAAGCGGPPPGGDDAGPVGSSSGATEPATTPATEGPTPTSAKKTTGGEPVLTVPEFPIGGGDDGDHAVRCVTVSYLSGTSIPAGVGLVVRGARIEQVGGPYFTTNGSGCGDEPACVGFTWNDDTRNEQCSVEVRETGKKKSLKDKRPNPRLVLSGRLDCPPGQNADCQTFRKKLNNGQPVRIVPPEAEAVTPSPDPTPTAGGS